MPRPAHGHPYAGARRDRRHPPDPVRGRRPPAQGGRAHHLRLDDYVYTALGEGASGFLLSDTPPERIIAAVHSVAAGDVLLAPAITARLVETYAEHHRAAATRSQLLDELTARETEVLRLIAAGLSNAEIAERFVLSEATVKTHVKRVMAKLGLASWAQAVVVAYESGLAVPAASRRLATD